MKTRHSLEAALSITMIMIASCQTPDHTVGSPQAPVVSNGSRDGRSPAVTVDIPGYGQAVLRAIRSQNTSASKHTEIDILFGDEERMLICDSETTAGGGISIVSRLKDRN